MLHGDFCTFCVHYSGELALSIQVPTLSPANNKRNIWKRQQGNNSFDYLETNSVDAPRKGRMHDIFHSSVKQPSYNQM